MRSVTITPLSQLSIEAGRELGGLPKTPALSSPPDTLQDAGAGHALFANTAARSPHAIAESVMGFSLQACIDENLDMVKFLVENGASVNQQDNEGWTPLHAAASCGYLNIAE